MEDGREDSGLSTVRRGGVGRGENCVECGIGALGWFDGWREGEWDEIEMR